MDNISFFFQQLTMGNPAVLARFAKTHVETGWFEGCALARQNDAPRSLETGSDSSKFCDRSRQPYGGRSNVRYWWAQPR